MIFDALEQAERFEIGDHAGACFEAVEPGVLSGSLAHVRVVGHHVDFGEVVAPADLEVVRDRAPGVILTTPVPNSRST